mmetsp:Transcript_2413/g.5608  ORF Transcript_2413/g.5608 Transcript_2413/m.5608 type:complete len:80 (-) Transcript_2413:25-264(-)
MSLVNIKIFQMLLLTVGPSSSLPWRQIPQQLIKNCVLVASPSLNISLMPFRYERAGYFRRESRSGPEVGLICCLSKIRR